MAGTETASAVFRKTALPWLLAGTTAPFLAFPMVVPWATIVALGLVALGLLWSGHGDDQSQGLRAQAGRLWVPWVVLGVSVLCGVAMSPFPELTLPKLCGVVLGMLVLRAVLLTAATAARIQGISAAYALAGIAILVAGSVVKTDGIVPTGWTTDPFFYVKFPSLWVFSSSIPRFVDSLPGAEQGVNPNALGGTTLFFLPLLMALMALRLGPGWMVGVRPWLWRAACGTALSVVILALVLSQSRTSWIAAIAGVVAIAAARYRAVVPLVAAGTAAIAGWWWYGALDNDAVFGYGRLTAWSVAADAIREHPLRGVGLGALRGLAAELQAGAAEPMLPLVHAHNVFLQVALDAGAMGLLAYVALLAVATKMTFEVARDDGAWERTLCLGLWGSLVAVHLFGLTDAIALGAKVGLFFWWNLGLIAAIHRYRVRHSVSQAV